MQETLLSAKSRKTTKTYTCYWYKDLVRGKNGHWYISLAMLPNQNELKNVLYPIGALPNFRLGRQYHGRRDVTVSPRGSFSVARFADLAQGELVNAWPSAKPFFHFYQDQNIGKQWLWQIEADGITYFIPCVELMRALFMPNSTFARALFRPSGLAELSPPPKSSETSLHFDFFPNVPVSSVTSKVALRLLGWLHTDEAARGAWYSVYKKHASARHRDKPSIPARFRPPSIKNIAISMRGIENRYDRAEFLVLEIEKIVFPELAINHISYSHPKIQEQKERDRASGGARTVVTKKAKKNTEESKADSKSGLNAVVVKTPVTLIESAEPLYIEVIRKSTTAVGSANRLDKSLPPSSTVRKSVSANDVSKEGTAAPLEFKSVGRDDLKKDDGLYVFSAAIKSIANANPTWQVIEEIFELQGDSVFCFAFGRRRRCLLAKFELPGRMPVWLVEIERTGGIMRSTLVIRAKSKGGSDHIAGAMRAISESLETTAGRWPETKDSWIENYFDISRAIHPFDYERMDQNKKIEELHKQLTEAVLSS